MSVRVLTKVLQHSEAELATRLVLLVLADAAHDDGVTWIGQGLIAEKARVADSTVRECLKRLVASGEVEARKAQRGRRRINVYRVVLPGLLEVDYDRLPFELDQPFASARPPESGGRQDDDDRRSTDVTAADPPLPKKEEPLEDPSDIEQVRDAWLAEDEVISHRPSYFEQPDIQRAIRKAVERYETAAVVQAIRNYGAVLASSQHFFSYSGWTLRDFLQPRALDRFVPEADPLRNFRRDRDTRGGPTADDFPDLDPLG